MTLEELEKSAHWSNEEYFDYMKETGNWNAVEDPCHSGNPCERCGSGLLESVKLDVYFPIDEGGCHATEFEICRQCMLELHGAIFFAHLHEKEDSYGNDQQH